MSLLKNALYLIAIATIVTSGWQLIELELTGSVNPNDVDTIIGVILTISLFYNLKSLIGD